MEKKIFRVFESIPKGLILSQKVRDNYKLFSSFEHTKKAIKMVLKNQSKGNKNTFPNRGDTPTDYKIELSDLTQVPNCGRLRDADMCNQ